MLIVIDAATAQFTALEIPCNSFSAFADLYYVTIRLPIQVLEPLALLHLGMKRKGTKLQDFQQRLHTAQAVQAVCEDQSPPTTRQQQVVQIHIL